MITSFYFPELHIGDIIWKLRTVHKKPKIVNVIFVKNELSSRLFQELKTIFHSDVADQNWPNYISKDGRTNRRWSGETYVRYSCIFELYYSQNLFFSQHFRRFPGASIRFSRWIMDKIVPAFPFWFTGYKTSLFCFANRERVPTYFLPTFWFRNTLYSYPYKMFVKKKFVVTLMRNVFVVYFENPMVKDN